MCVIAYKPENISFMKKATLAECFESNPDGAGFMYAVNNSVHIRKGFMTFEKFWKALKSVRDECGDMIPYVMHFRISTQAGVNQQCCHPYPLSARMDDLKMLSSKAKIGIAHNGVIHLTSDGAKDYNDTMKFITDYVPFFVKNLDWWKNKSAKKALEILCGSKLAILGGDGHCELIGDFIKDGGCYYSNSSYKPAPKTWFDLDYGFKNGRWTFRNSQWGWEMYYNSKKRRYDFTETFCPVSEDGDYSYCEGCKNFGKCQRAEYYEDEIARVSEFDDEYWRDLK